MAIAVLCLAALGNLVALRAANLAKEIDKRSYVFWEDSSYGKSVEKLHYATLRKKIEAVQDLPCEVYFGRNILAHPQTGGFLAALTRPFSAKVSLETYILGEESGLNVAMFLKPAKLLKNLRLIHYFKGRKRGDGSCDLRTALSLRRKARILKFNFWLEDHTGKPLSEITEADLPPLRATEEYMWLANDIFEPVTVIIRPEFSRSLFKKEEDIGPAFGARPTLNLLTRKQLGDRKAELVKGCVVDEAGHFIVRRTDSVVLVSDLDEDFIVKKAIRRDSLGDVVGHELFHGIMQDLMGRDTPGGIKSRSLIGHTTHLITDYSLALSEGWAEFFEAWSGLGNSAFDNKDGKSKVTQFLLGRQVPIRRNLYSQADFETYRATKKNGRIKTGSQMEATEGLVAAVFYSLMTNEKIPQAFELILEAFYRHKPQRMTEVITAMMKCADSATTRRIIALDFLHLTKFATVSHEAWRLYQDSYTAKLAFVRYKNSSDANDDEAKKYRQIFSRARKLYDEFTAELEGKVIAGSLALDGNIGPDIWMGAAGFGKDREGYSMHFQTSFNLNTATEKFFIDDLGMKQEYASELVHARNKHGFIEELDDMYRHISPEAREAFDSVTGLWEIVGKGGD